MWQSAAIFGGFYLAGVASYSSTSGHCTDIHSQVVAQGAHYVPGPNSCTLCICDKGGPKWCKSVLCSQPQNCKSFQRGNSCCEFKCLDDILTANDTYKDTYDLALRLIASAVFVILTLSLLFFVVHRFRRHKLRVRQNRQLGDDQRSLNSIGYITGSIGYLPGNMGYLGSGNNDLEFHYEESNPHFNLWKPPGNYFPRGEAPPPYEEAIRSAQIEPNIIAHNNATLVTATPNNSTQMEQSRPIQVSTNTMQCRHQYLTNRSAHNLEYANVNLETSNHREPAVKHDRIKQQDPRGVRTIPSLSNKNAKNRASEKSKSYENILIRPMSSSSSSDRKPVKHRLAADYERDKNNPKYHKYENIIIRNSTLKEPPSTHWSRATETHKPAQHESSEVFYENINPAYENVRHRIIPLVEYTKPPQMRESKSKDSLFVLVENVNKHDLDKSRFGERSDGNLKNLSLKDCRDVPLHRTLPKNLKELAVSVSSNGALGERFKYIEAETLMHRTLPKQLNHDAVLSANLFKSQMNLSENCAKNVLACKPPDFESASSSYTPVPDYKHEEKPKAKEDERNFISYQCLSSSQDEDDYRSECENCKSTEISVDDEEGDVVETMTLQRRPETSEEVPYYRTSLTLPTQIRKPRAVTPNPNRSGWFMAMQETSSSEESE